MDFSFGSKSPEDKLINALQNPNASQSQIDSALKNISSLDNPEKAKRIFTAMKSRRDREASFPPPKSSWFVWSRPGRLENADLTTVLSVAKKCLPFIKTKDQPGQEAEEVTKKGESQTFGEAEINQIKEIAKVITQYAPIPSNDRPNRTQNWSWICFSRKSIVPNEEECSRLIEQSDLGSLNEEDQRIFDVVGYNRLRKLFNRIPKEQPISNAATSEIFEQRDHPISNRFLDTLKKLTVPKLSVSRNEEIDGLIQTLETKDKNSKEFTRALKKIDSLPYILPEKRAKIILALAKKPLDESKGTDAIRHTSKEEKRLVEKLYNEETQKFLGCSLNPSMVNKNYNDFMRIIRNLELKDPNSIIMDRAPKYDKSHPWALIVDVEDADNKTEKICLGYFQNPIEEQLQSYVSKLCDKIPGKVVSANLSCLDNTPTEKYGVIDINKVRKDPIKKAQLNKIAKQNKLPEGFTAFKAMTNLTAYSIPQGDGSFKEIDVVEEMEDLFERGDDITKVTSDLLPKTFVDDFIGGRAQITCCGQNFEKSRRMDLNQPMEDRFSAVKEEYKKMCEEITERGIKDPNALFVIMHQGAAFPLALYSVYLARSVNLECERYKPVPPSITANFKGENFVIEYESRLQYQTKEENEQEYTPIAEVSWKCTVTIPIAELQKVTVEEKNNRYVLKNIPSGIQATESWGDYTPLS